MADGTDAREPGRWARRPSGEVGYNAAAMPSPRHVAAGVGFVVLISLVPFVPLGDTAAFRPDDESFHLRIAAEMYDRGDIWVPTWFGRPALNKPPLTYWLFFAGFAARGVNLAAARLPVALLAVGTVLLTALLGRSLYGTRAGLLAGLLTATSLGAVEFGPVGMMDIPLCFLLTLAIYALVRALKTGNPAWGALFFAAAGVSTLSKGPFSLFILGALAAALGLRQRQKARDGLLHPLALAGAAAGALTVVAWPLALWTRGLFSQWYSFFVVHENLGKFEDVQYPWWIIGEYFLVFLLPWSPLVLAAAWTLARGRAYRDLRVFLPLAWVLIVLLFHELPATKLKHYVLPAIPPAALLVAAVPPAWTGRRAMVLGRVGVQALLAIAAIALLGAGRIVPGAGDRLLVGGAIVALLTAIWTLARPRSLVWAASAYGCALLLVLMLLPAVSYSRLPREALPCFGSGAVAVVRQQVYVYSCDLGREVPQLTTRAEYLQALRNGAMVIVSDTDRHDLAGDRDAAGIEEVCSWPQWKRVLPPRAVVRALATGDTGGLVERVRVLRASTTE